MCGAASQCHMAAHQIDPCLICRLSVSQDETERHLRAKAVMDIVGSALNLRHLFGREMYFCKWITSNTITPHICQPWQDVSINEERSLSTDHFFMVRTEEGECQK